MSKLTIVANFIAKNEKIELVKSELLKLVSITLKEDGCIQYDLHQDNENPARFMFYEIWESKDKWLTHMEASHLKAYQKATEGAIEDFSLFEMYKL